MLVLPINDSRLCHVQAHVLPKPAIIIVIFKNTLVSTMCKMMKEGEREMKKEERRLKKMKKRKAIAFGLFIYYVLSGCCLAVIVNVASTVRIVHQLV